MVTTAGEVTTEPDTGDDPSSNDWNVGRREIRASRDYFGHMKDGAWVPYTLAPWTGGGLSIRERDLLLDERDRWVAAGKPRHPGGNPVREDEPERTVVAETERENLKPSQIAAAVYVATGLVIDIAEPHPPSDPGWVSPFVAPERPVEPSGRPLGARNAPRGSPAPDGPTNPIIRDYEAQAGAWSRGKGLPHHRAKRYSQTPEGRRERYLRDVAERDHITVKEAARLHPARPVKKEATA